MFHQIKQLIKKILPQSTWEKLKKMRQKLRKKSSYGREELLRKDISKEQIGLEIGPSHHPIVSKKEGYHVEVVDWLDQQGLREQYKGHGVDLDAIEVVDYVWKGGSYCNLIGKKACYDYVIASHMIEHTTDFLGFLRDCSELLKDEGILRLAIPDKRYCFDHFRDVTGLAEVLNNFYYPCEIHSVGNVTEYHLNVVKYKNELSWNKKFGKKCNSRKSDKHYSFVHTLDYAKEWIAAVKDEKKYRDIHHYVFTPASFELLIDDLRMLELLDLEIAEVHAVHGNEFLVTMRKTTDEFIVNPGERKRKIRKRNKENRI